MPDRLFRKAKAAAALHGWTLKELIASAVEREVDELPESQAISMEQWLREYQALGKKIEVSSKSSGRVVAEIGMTRR